MIVAAVVCPHPPLLLRELTGAQDTVPALREACRGALATALAGGVDEVVVVGGADRTAPWDPATPVEVGGFGTTDDPGTRAEDGLPLSLGVGRRLLDEAGWAGPTTLQAVAWSAGPEEVEGAAASADRPGRTLLLVLGEGSARRGEKAPGYLDERASGFDEALVAALVCGDAEALRDLDAPLAEELMVLGRAAFAALGRAVTGAVTESEVLYSGAPYGVQYTVARFVCGRSAGSR